MTANEDNSTLWLIGLIVGGFLLWRHWSGPASIATTSTTSGHSETGPPTSTEGSQSSGVHRAVEVISAQYDEGGAITDVTAAVYSAILSGTPVDPGRFGNRTGSLTVDYDSFGEPRPRLTFTGADMFSLPGLRG